MSSGNRINIPWYRRKVNYSAGSGITPPENPTIDFGLPRIPKPRSRTRGRGRQKPERERVRERVRETVREREPSRVPNRYPILDPRQQPNPQDDHGKNPYREPGTNPIPLPTPLPNPVPAPRGKPGNPGVNQKQPMPQAPVPGGGFALPYEIPSIIPPEDYKFKVKNYTDDQKQWANDFITNLELVARLTAIEAKQLYSFTRDYDYESNNLGQFTTDAQAEFGVAAGSILAIIVGAKSLGQLWGKRITAGFAPVIKLDDEFMQDYFGTKTY